ncbi:Putative coat protein [Gracilibacillus ureilyticus]|uniref:Putative coat protein n=1 Tax=Gracilibacillus ureilyticus TaxID=531814 RepID=A0A1H9TIE9_9BACI|nr:YlbD family protein [Gracilibacillus ureilyticus]SER96941.1 Putative coat protein [Gracilibacillus ureilyticus]
MVKKTNNPSVQQFKDFLHRNPQLIKSIRSGNINLQECFEQFVLLGENDPVWEQYGQSAMEGNNDHNSKYEDEKKFSKWLDKISQLDLNHVEKHIHDLHGAIDQVIKVIDQYKHFTNGGNDRQSIQSGRDPFSFRIRD